MIAISSPQRDSDAEVGAAEYFGSLADEPTGPTLEDTHADENVSSREVASSGPFLCTTIRPSLQ